jgi:hypothetical protein
VAVFLAWLVWTVRSALRQREIGVAACADERKKLERLCRYISRPAISEKRLSLTPLAFIDTFRIPPPRLRRHRYQGVLAPNIPRRLAATADGREADLTHLPPPPEVSPTATRLPLRPAGAGVAVSRRLVAPKTRHSLVPL